MKTFKQIVKATERNFTIEKSVSGYYRLMEDGEVYFDDSAVEELNGSLEVAEAFFGNLLMEEAVPAEKKCMKGGIWFLNHE